MTFQEKNGSNYNEMTDYQMASIENLKTSNRGFELSCEFVNFPISFVNGIRRILLANIPTVAIQNVEIVTNTTQLPHEMLKHRMEMLPVNVLPSDTATIKETKVEGKPLNSAHQPILFALPDYLSVQKMAFISIQGSAENGKKNPLGQLGFGTN
jgi:hypothetical protein